MAGNTGGVNAANPDGDEKVWVRGHGLMNVSLLVRQNAELRAKARMLEEDLTMARAKVTNQQIDQELLRGYRRAIEENRTTIQGLEQQVYEAKEGQQEAESLVRDLEATNDGLRRAMVAMDSGWLPPRPVPPQLVASLEALIQEYWRAKDKHGEMTMDGRMKGDPVASDLLRLAALMEEVGEVSELFTYDKDEEGDSSRPWAQALMKELVQVANVALTWDSYLRHPGPTVQRQVGGVLTTWDGGVVATGRLVDGSAADTGRA